MLPKQKAVLSALILGVSTLGELALGYFFIVLLAQRLGPAGLGAYYYVISIASAATLFSYVNPPQLILLKVARSSSALSEFFGHCLVINLLAFVVAALAMTCIAILSTRPEDFTLAVLVAIATAFSGIFSNLFETVAKAHENVVPFAISRPLERALALGLLLAFTSRGPIGIATVMLLVAVSNLTQLACLWGGVRRYLTPAFTWSARELMAVLVEGRPYVLANVLALLHARTDVLLLGWLTSNEQVGYYTAAVQLYQICLMAMVIVESAIFARLAALATSNPEAFRHAVHDTLRYLLVGVVGACAGLVLLADDIILVIFGEMMGRSIWVLQMLGTGLFFSCHTALFLVILACVDRQPLATRLVAITAGVNLVANYVLIHFYGYVGATFATVASAVLSFTLSLAAVRKTVGLGIPLVPVLKALAAAGLMAGVVFALADVCGRPTRMLSGGFAFALALVGLRYFGAEDYALWRGMLVGRLRRS